MGHLIIYNNLSQYNFIIKLVKYAPWGLLLAQAGLQLPPAAVQLEHKRWANRPTRVPWYLKGDTYLLSKNSPLKSARMRDLLSKICL